MTWHASTALLERYGALGLDTARSASVEQHLLSCATCRAELSSITFGDGVAAGELDDLWLDVIDAVDLPRRGMVGSLLERVGCRDHVSQIVAATPALRLSWLASIVLALAFAVGAALQAGADDAVLLIIAPLIPLAGIGTAYGAGVDPMHELVRAAPLPGSRIFLYRSLAVLATALPLTLAASVALRLDGWVALAWLLPSLGLVGATLALSTWMEPRLAAAVAGAGWLVVLVSVRIRSAGNGVAFEALAPFRPAGQALFAGLGVAGALVFAMRFGRFDAPDARRSEVR